MICNLSKLSKFAVFVFYSFFLLHNSYINALDQLDIILCGRKGNQYYVTSTPFITKGAYLYADLLIKTIDGPWPVKRDGTPYTMDEYKLEIVRKIILTSPARLRMAISNIIPPKNSDWDDIMGRMNKYPKQLKLINDIRFSVFLCGPDMLDSPVLLKFIEKINRKYGYKFNPFSDKVTTAALRMHGVQDSTIKRKLALSELKSSSIKAQEKEHDKIQKNVHVSPPVETSLEPTKTDDQSLIVENKPVISQKPSLVLNESEFEEFKDERFFESDYSKTPPFPEEGQKQSSLPSSAEVSEISNELPETILVTTGTNSLPELSSHMPNSSDIRVSHINKNTKYSLDFSPETVASTESHEAVNSESITDTKDKNELNEDIGDIDLSSKLNLNENINIQNSPVENTESQPTSQSQEIENRSILEPEIQIENEKIPRPDYENRVLEYNSKGTIGPPPDHKPLEIPIPSLENSEDSTGLEEDAMNYKEQEEIANKIEADQENYNYEDEYEDYEENDEEYEFASEDEYNQYLDYKDSHLRNKQVSEDRLVQKEKKLLHASYPIGKSANSKKALLQDVSSVFTDLLNAVKANKISEKSIAFGIPTINLKLNTRSKAIVFKDRIINKWRAQNIDGILKSIPIFHQGSFDELSHSTKDQLPTSNTSKMEATYIEVDFNSAIKSHDKNEGGYVWMQRNLIATRTTSGFQDVLIKAALKGLETLTSIQCSAILSLPISSTEVEDCISTYFGSIFFGQNKVYGAMTQTDEENSIHGFEVTKAFMPSSPDISVKSQSPLLEKFEDADLLIRNHIKLSEEKRAEKRDEPKTPNLDMTDKLVRRNLEIMPSSISPETNLKGTDSNLVGATLKDKRSQFSENSEEYSDEVSEEEYKDLTAPSNTTAKGTDMKPLDILPSENKRLGFSRDQTNVPSKEKSMEISTEEVSHLSPKDDNTKDYKVERIPDEFKDPEFVEKALEKLAINATETYKKISNEFKIPSSDLETISMAYDEFLDKVELWSAIAGEALIFTGKKMKGIIVSKSTKLSYFYSREEFYVYQAILNYSSSLVSSINSFNNLKKNLEEIKELLRKSFTSVLTYTPIKNLSKQFNDNLELFNASYNNNLKIFCSSLPVNECLGVMKNDFYRRNEKFSNFIARNSSLKRAVHQILELFNIKVSTKDHLSIQGSNRDDVNRYLAIKGYISNQVPIFTKKFNKKLLKEQLNIDKNHAEFAIKELLDKHGLNSKTLSCGEVRWEQKNKNPTPVA